MKVRSAYAVILVSAPSVGIARKLASAVLNARLAACANLVPRVESHYWWQGRLESSAEVLILFKTTKARLKALEKLVTGRHPYDTPEFVVLPLPTGSKRYLDWIKTSVRPVRK
jgi:periplasmic divalent cation tolerance protein